MSSKYCVRIDKIDWRKRSFLRETFFSAFFLLFLDIAVDFNNQIVNHSNFDEFLANTSTQN